MKPLETTVAIVTGASRGAGRGIAVELGAAGATVYCTGRSTREAPADTYGKLLAQGHLAAMPGSIDETAEAVTAAGGRGVAVRCDATSDSDVRDLIARVERDHGKLDVLVNNAWGGHETLTGDTLDRPFWDQPLEHWESMFDRGVRNHVVACRAAAPLFVRQQRGLIVATTYWDRGKYIKGNLFYDLAKAAICRLAFSVAEELCAHHVTSLAVSPGWMRTELILAAFGTDEARWQQVPPLARTESPRYVGRAVAALAADANVFAKTGGVYQVGDLAKEYQFADIDGRWIPPFEL
ncbi:MAG TPA: SDR family oxidoreductase [Kofleriaceae bacterium]|nr:SDR family oxidoreductase [Kofleriaceae bacterium]